jgi:DNA uptake protein ComE-like DNA-binding protein
MSGPRGDDAPAPEDWLPAGLSRAPSEAAARVVEPAEAVPVDPATTAELGAEVQRLRDELGEAQKRARDDHQRADRAERELAALQERVTAMKRAAAQAAAASHPGDGGGAVSGKLDLNSASFEQLRDVGLSVTQAARLIGQREQHGGFASVDDVDRVVGLPRDVKQSLKEHGRV